MRQPDFGGQQWQPNFRLRWNCTSILLAAYVVVFLAQQLTEIVSPHSHFFDYLVLSRAGLAHGYVWQLISYQFLHAGWMHLILNCWAIFIFGNELEYLLGARRYLTVFFTSGILGGVFQVLSAILLPKLFDGGVVGASACAFGLVAAFATIFPDRELTMLFFFIIPVRLKAKTLLLLSLVVALAGIIFPWDNVANAAHLGGMAMGWFYVKMVLKNPALIGAPEPEPRYRAEPVKPVEKSVDDFGEADVDTVLDKISARGINSLTSRERAILEAARKKMAQR